MPNIKSREQLLNGFPAEIRESVAKNMQNVWNMNKKWPRYNAINCWHMNEHESAAMWKLYLKSNEGVAVQSRYKALRDSIIYDQPFYMGLVRYIDYENDVIPDGNILSPFIHKRRSFEHEREVRILIAKWPIGDNGIDTELETIDFGIRVRTDLRSLIENVYVAPGSPSWFVDLVRAVIIKYGYKFEVIHSKMDDKALF